MTLHILGVPTFSLQALTQSGILNLERGVVCF